MDRLASALAGFSRCMETFALPSPVSRTVGELLEDTNWPWGYANGLYCFVSAGTVVYVGRAIGASLGSRLWSHLNSLEDPDWAAIARDASTVVLTYEFEPQALPLAAALEVHLIRELEPRFNRRIG